MDPMHTPNIFLAYAPRLGLRCAVAYLSSGRDAYGWFTGLAADGAMRSAYFVLEDHYAPTETRYIEVREDGLHSAWTTDEARCHEMASLQDAFSHEWLAVRGDPAAEADLGKYAQGELAAGDVNIRFERLSRLDKDQPTWTFYSPHFEDGVLKTLSRHWPLDFRASGY